MHFILLGIKKDQVRLTALAKQISGFGHAAQHLTLSSKVSRRLAEDANFGELVVLHCWTKNSIGTLGSALQAHAIAAKEAGIYRGLICEDVEVPEAVRDAVDFRLRVAAEPDVDAPVKDLIQQLEQAFAKSTWPKFNLRYFGEWVITQIEALRKKYKLTRWLITACAGLVAFVAGVGPPVAEWLAKRLPTEQNEQWWRVEPLSDCKNFEAYLSKYGADAPFSAEAELRLKLAHRVPGERRVDLTPFLMTARTGPGTFASSKLAHEDALRRANAEASQYCSAFEPVLGKAVTSPKFEAVQTPECEYLGGGYRCKIQGKAICASIVTDEELVCSK